MLIFIFSFHLVLKFFFLPHLCSCGICYCFCCADATPTNAPPGSFSLTSLVSPPKKGSLAFLLS